MGVATFVATSFQDQPLWEVSVPGIPAGTGPRNAKSYRPTPGFYARWDE